MKTKKKMAEGGPAKFEKTKEKTITYKPAKEPSERRKKRIAEYIQKTDEKMGIPKAKKGGSVKKKK